MLKNHTYLAIFFTLAAMLLFSCPAKAQDDVFAPIGKYIAQGDAERLSAWFAPSIEMGILRQDSPTSKAQARQLVKAFFSKYPPRSFNVTHKASKGNGKYAIGTLNAGGENFIVSIVTTLDEKTGSFLIQQISISR